MEDYQFCSNRSFSEEPIAKRSLLVRLVKSLYAVQAATVSTMMDLNICSNLHVRTYGIKEQER